MSKIGTDFLIDYAINQLEVNGDLAGFTKNKGAYATIYSRLTKKVPKDHKKKSKGNTGIKAVSVKDFLYGQIGIHANEYILGEDVYRLKLYSSRYNSLKNLNKIDNYLYKKIQSTAKKNHLTYDELMTRMGYGQFLKQEPYMLDLEWEGKVFNLLGQKFKIGLEYNSQLFMYLTMNIKSNSDLSWLKENDPIINYITGTLYNSYGGVLDKDTLCTASVDGCTTNCSCLFYNNKWYTTHEMTTKNPYIFALNVICACLGYESVYALTPYIRYLIDNYLVRYGNLNYMHRLNMSLYNYLLAIYFKSNCKSLKEFLRREHWNLTELKYQPVNYIGCYDDETIKARLWEQDGYKHIITLDKSVYALLLAEDWQQHLVLKETEFNTAQGKKLGYEVALNANKTSKGIKDLSVPYLYMGKVPSYANGNTLDISTNNII